MKELSFVTGSTVYLEIGQTSLKVVKDDIGMDLPLERDQNGRLTGPCKTRLIERLRSFVNRKSWLFRPRAVCAIGANGVSVRHLALPASGKEKLQKLLSLQIESEFPLPPEELAWGFQPLAARPANGAPATQELLVAAIRKEVLEEYSSLLAACGMNPVFTIAALARARLCPAPLESCAILDLDKTHSELAVFSDGSAITIRTFPVGNEDLSPPGAGLDELTKFITNNWTGGKLYLTAGNDLPRDMVQRLGERLGRGVDCRRLEFAPGKGRSAALLGLMKSPDETEGMPLLVLQVKPKQTDGTISPSSPALRKWVAAAVGLLLCLFALPYVEAVFLKPVLSRKLTAIKADTGRLAIIDRELVFLQNLKQSQPPYLDALYLFAKSAPRGSSIESLSMNRRGEITLRGSMRSSEQVSGFRSKLIESGFFTNVVVEEQVPTRNRQKVDVRMTARWKSPEARAVLSIGPTKDEIEKAKEAAKKEGPQRGMPTPGMPPMPAGMPMPMPMPPGGLRPAPH